MEWGEGRSSQLQEQRIQEPLKKALQFLVCFGLVFLKGVGEIRNHLSKDPFIKFPVTCKEDEGEEEVHP